MTVLIHLSTTHLIYLGLHIEQKTVSALLRYHSNNGKDDNKANTSSSLSNNNTDQGTAGGEASNIHGDSSDGKPQDEYQSLTSAEYDLE